MSKYDNTFDEKQIALYNYDATYKNVDDLFYKYRMFKGKVQEFYKKLGSSSKTFSRDVVQMSRNRKDLSRDVEQIVNLKLFIDACDTKIKEHSNELNYYEQWIFDEVLIGGNRLSKIENDVKYNRSHGFLTSAKKSCRIKVSLWFDVYVLNDTLLEELKSYKDYACNSFFNGESNMKVIIIIAVLIILLFIICSCIVAGRCDK